MKTALSICLGVLYLISCVGFASATLNIKADVNSAATNEKSVLYCGLALPPEGDQGEQGQDTEQGEDSPSPTPTPNPEFQSNSLSDEEPNQD